MLEKHKRLEELIPGVKKSIIDLDEIESIANQIKNQLHAKLKEYAIAATQGNYNEDGLRQFEKKWWTIVRYTNKSGNPEATLVVPKQYDMNFGYLIPRTEEDGFNHFKVNPITIWISDIPEKIKNEFGFPEPLDIGIVGNTISGPDISKVESKFKEFVKRSGNKLEIKPDSYVDVIVGLLQQGTMPFDKPNPIPKQYLRKTESTIELRDYQKDAINKFLQHSRVGIFWPTGVGKSYPAIQAMCELVPRYLIICNKTAIEQWKTRIESYTKLQESDYDITTFQGGLKKYLDNQYTLVIVDEGHHVLANTYSQFLQIKPIAFMMLTASPYREDGRAEYLIPICGYPIGLNWKEMQKLGVYTPPDCHVWLVKKTEDKLKLVQTILKEDKKTIIFCDHIEYGEQVSKKLQVPFVHGNSENRLQTLLENQTVVGSRVLDESISDPKIERGIEIDFLGKSRTQFLQRVGRINHSKVKGKKYYHCIMTIDEYQKFRTRLVVTIEKGMKTFYHNMTDSSISEIQKQVKPTFHKQKSGKPQKTIRTSKPTKPKTDRLTPQEREILSHYPSWITNDAETGYTKRKDLIILFLDPKNRERQFTPSQLCVVVDTDIRHLSMYGMGYMKKKKLVKRNNDGSYTQNISSLIT